MSWTTTLYVKPGAVKLLVSDECGTGLEILRARLPPHPEHPRALLTLLEGMALWSGSPVTAAISAAESVWPLCDGDLFGGLLYPAESVMVHFETVAPVQARRLRGMGNFREVLRHHGKRGLP